MNSIRHINVLLEKLSQHNIKYCHWKSNYRLEDSLAGRVDLDLLISRKNAKIFETILSEMGFRLAKGPDWDRHDSVYHFYGCDEQSKKIIHVHAYYRLVTGGSLVKNYRLPLEEMLFSNIRIVENIKIPTKGAELLLFVLRKGLEASSIIEYPFMRMENTNIVKELVWLHTPDSETEALELLRKWLPSLDSKLFIEFLNVIELRRFSFRRFWIGRQMRRFLKNYAVCSGIVASIKGGYRLVRFLGQRLICRAKGYSPSAGGLVIAFVGSEASGKSTTLVNVKEWLGRHFSIATAHSGKPRSSWLTILPNLFLPLLRKSFPKHRLNTYELSKLEKKDSGEQENRSILFLLRSLIVAYDQKRELLRAFGKASKGAIVLCDRYPSATLGGMDGPRVDPLWFNSKYSLKKLIAKQEWSIYASIPTPDLVLFLKVPLDVAVRRNSQRVKEDGPESEEYVRRRYKIMEKWSVPNVPIKQINNNRSLEIVLAEIKSMIWQIL